MNVAETLLVFLGIPLAIVLVMAALIFLPGGHKRPRYRPGQPWEHEPIWYEPHPEHSPAAGHGGGHGAEGTALASSVYPEHQALPAGSGGTSTATAPAPAKKAGPLGGARGTW